MACWVCPLNHPLEMPHMGDGGRWACQALRAAVVGPGLCPTVLHPGRSPPGSEPQAYCPTFWGPPQASLPPTLAPSVPTGMLVFCLLKAWGRGAAGWGQGRRRWTHTPVWNWLSVWKAEKTAGGRRFKPTRAVGTEKEARHQKARL